MNHQPTDSRLLTWASNPWYRRRLSLVSPLTYTAIIPTKPGLAIRLARGIQSAIRSTIQLAIPGLLRRHGKNSGTEREDGCAVCRGAHFEIGAASAGQEYL